jgi:hypothetical protein
MKEKMKTSVFFFSNNIRFLFYFVLVILLINILMHCIECQKYLA